nr:hypothetical protein [Streptomyces sp. 2231.1]
MDELSEEPVALVRVDDLVGAVDDKQEPVLGRDPPDVDGSGEEPAQMPVERAIDGIEEVAVAAEKSRRHENRDGVSSPFSAQDLAAHLPDHLHAGSRLAGPRRAEDHKPAAGRHQLHQ